MEPLRITFDMGTPVIVPDTPIHLDGLLSWARVDEGTAGDEGAEPWSVQHDLPLEKFFTSSAWCFKASWLTFTWAGEPRAFHLSRRSDPVEFANAYVSGVLGKRKPSWNAASGPTKGYSILGQERLAVRAEAFAVGDADRISVLLSRVICLGKHHRLGKGLIRSFRVESVFHDACPWHRRHLPDDTEIAREGTVRAPGALSAPYWEKLCQTIVRIPIDAAF